MKSTSPSINAVFTQLQQEGLIENGWQPDVRNGLTEEIEEAPWYIRSLIAFGAWIASFFFLGFIGLLGWAVFDDLLGKSALLVFSLFCLVGATLLRTKKSQEFFAQVALAITLAGEVLLAIGLVIQQNYNFFSSNQDEVVVLLGLFVSQGILFLVYPDRTLRFLAVVAMIGEAIILIYVNHVPLLVHGILFLLAIVFTLLVLAEQKIYSTKAAEFFNPLKYGILIGLLCVMLVSTAYILPDFNFKNMIFPKPWISTLGMGVVLLYALLRITANAAFSVREAVKIVALAGAVCFVLLSWNAPGLVLSLVILLLGYHSANRIVTGIAITFFVIFLTAFFYGIEVSLLHKSYTLIGTGSFLLLAWYILHKQAGSQEVTRHA